MASGTPLGCDRLAWPARLGYAKRLPGRSLGIRKGASCASSARRTPGSPWDGELGSASVSRLPLSSVGPGKPTRAAGSGSSEAAEAVANLGACQRAGSRRSATASSPSSSPSWCSSCTCREASPGRRCGTTCPCCWPTCSASSTSASTGTTTTTCSRRCSSVNGAVLWANLHLLFWLSLVPFATAWMSENQFAAGPDGGLRHRPARRGRRLLRAAGHAPADARE